MAAYANSTAVMFAYPDLPNLCVIAWVLCFAVSVAFSILNSWQFSLIKCGMTSVEYKQLKAWNNGAVSPYDRGWKTNVAYILGIRGGNWLSILRPCYFIPNDYWSVVDLEDVDKSDV